MLYDNPKIGPDGKVDVSHEAILREIQAMREEIRPLVSDMSTLKDVIMAWKAATWFGKALKWIGGISAGAAALYTYIKTGGHI